MTAIQWQGGEHDFVLRIGELRALQDRCDAGPAFVLERLQTKRWRVEDVTETIRLALMGGGMERAEAQRIVALHVEAKPLSPSVMLATVVLAAALHGPLDEVDDTAGEPKAGEGATLSRAANGASLKSTDQPE
jgi:hypothetical protein